MICTLKGRVVYDRKLHKMNLNDAKRISEGAFKRNIPSYGFTITKMQEWIVLLFYILYGTLFLNDPRKLIEEFSGRVTGAGFRLIDKIAYFVRIRKYLPLKRELKELLDFIEQSKLSGYYSKYILELILKRRDPYGN